MAYEMVMPYHLHMPSYFLETFTEYPFVEMPNDDEAKEAIKQLNGAEYVNRTMVVKEALPKA